MSDLLQFNGLVRVEEVPEGGMIAVRGDLSVKSMKAVLVAMGLAMPEVRKIHIVGDQAVAWMSPDEILVFVPEGQLAIALETLTAGLADEHALVVDVSDMRARFRLSGAKAREVLAKVMPIDFSVGTFGVGDIRRSRLAQVAAACWMPGEDVIEVICFRSVAQYAFDVMRVSAIEDTAVGFYSN